MKYPKDVWEQLKGKTADDIISALLKDGFKPDDKLRTERVYRRHDGMRITIHYHKKGTSYRQGLLKALLEDTGWSIDDMRRLKLIK